MATIKRQTAKKCRIKHLLQGRYVKREGWEPSYVETIVGKISRVNLVGIIIYKEEDNNLLLDDGSGSIQLRRFEDSDKEENVGDVVLVIGRPRVFNDQAYVVPEIIKKIKNPKWLEYRKKELQTSNFEKNTSSNKTEKQEKSSKSEAKEQENITDLILKKIDELDQGKGVRIAEILDEFESENTNVAINRLIEEGEIFEMRPGIVKLI